MTSFLTALAAHLEPPIRHSYCRAATSLAEEMISQQASASFLMKRKGGEGGSKFSGGLNERIERDIHLLQLAGKVMEFVEKKASAEQKILLIGNIEIYVSQHLLRPMMERITRFQAQHNKVEIPEDTNMAS